VQPARVPVRYQKRYRADVGKLERTEIHPAWQLRRSGHTSADPHRRHLRAIESGVGSRAGPRKMTVESSARGAPHAPPKLEALAPLHDLTVRSIRARAVDVRLKQPAVTAAGTFPTFPVVLIDLQADEGVKGSVYIFAYHQFAVKPLVLLIEGLGELICGRRLRPRDVEALLQRRLLLLGAQGLAGIALGGLDMAVWDAAARAANLPLAVLLGADPRPIRAYGTLKTMTPDGAARDAVNAVAKGFAGVKVKIGGTSVAEDVAVIEAIRREVGPRMAIMPTTTRSCRYRMRSPAAACWTSTIWPGSKSRHGPTTSRDTRQSPARCVRRSVSARLGTVYRTRLAASPRRPPISSCPAS